MVEATGGEAGAGPVDDTFVELDKGGPTTPGHTALVVAFDRSAASMTALTRAVELGERLGADLHVVHAVDLSDYPVDPDAADWEEQGARSVEEERQRVRATLDAYPGRWTYLALRADPTQALIRAADRVDAYMIVIGVRSTGWRHLVERIGGPSVSGRLLTHGHRPLLLVPAQDR